MKNLYWILLALALTAVACRKESLIPIDETETEEPSELEGLFFKGAIIDGKNNVSDALVEVYQNEKLVGTKTTGADGAFNTAGISLEAGKHVTFYVKHKNFNPHAKRVNGTAGNADLGKLKLSTTDLVPANIEPLVNPGSNDLIVVSGYVKSPQGNPVQASVLLLYDISEPEPFNYEAKGEGAETDANGYFEMLLPKDQEFYYFAFQEGCVNKLLTKEDSKIFESLPVELIGPFTQNTQLATLNNGLEQTDVKITARFLITGINCAGELLKNGAVKGTFEKGTETIPFEFKALVGIFFPAKDLCVEESNAEAPLNIRLKILDYDSGLVSDELYFQNVQLDDNLGVVSVCETPITNKGYISFNLVNKAYFFEIGTGAITAGDTLYSNTTYTNSNGLIRFLVPGYSSGKTEIKSFRFLSSLVDGGFNFEQRPGDSIEVNFEASSDPNKIPGTFSGSISNELGLSVPITGKFRILLP
ncbi:MAG: hypothetical protein U0V54_05705 [Saprospiraceae bacterium]